MQTLKQAISFARNNISVYVEPMIKSIGSLDGTLKNNSLKTFLVLIDEDIKTYKSAGRLLLNMIDEFEETLSSIENSKLKNENAKNIALDLVEMIEDSTSFLGTVMLNDFEDEIPPAKRTYIAVGSAKTAKLYKSIINSSITEDLENITADVPRSVIISRGVRSTDETDGWGLFTIFRLIPETILSIGKYFKRRKKVRVNLLEKQRDYMRLELLELELNVEGTEAEKLAKQKEYYRDLIDELEQELAELKSE